jgi:hypothetical protein
MGKKKKKRPISHIKKTLIPKNMWKLKSLKIQRTFQNFKTSKVLYHIWMGYNVHDVWRRIVVYYTRKHKNLKNQMLVMIWNCYHLKRWNTKFTRNQFIFKNSYLFKKKCHLPKQLYAFFITIWNIYIQKFIRMKFVFWQKEWSSFLK